VERGHQRYSAQVLRTGPGLRPGQFLPEWQVFWGTDLDKTLNGPAFAEYGIDMPLIVRLDLKSSLAAGEYRQIRHQVCARHREPDARARHGIAIERRSDGSHDASTIRESGGPTTRDQRSDRRGEG